MTRKPSRPAPNNIMAPRHDWNSWGPKVPPWFLRKLRHIDPALTLQYVPPNTLDPQGMNASQYPYGGWQICRKLPRTGWLHKVVVWSLVDKAGFPAPPGPDTVKILRMARQMWRHHDHSRMQDMLEDSIKQAQRAKAEKSEDALYESLETCLSILGHRQFSNRVFTRSPKLAQEIL